MTLQINKAHKTTVLNQETGALLPGGCSCSSC